MHIPKTGGMSMFTTLSTIWKTSIADLYDVSARKAEAGLEALKDPNKAIYCGHYSFGLHEWLDRPSYYVSVLREPVARITSLYHYCIPGLQEVKSFLNEGRLNSNVAFEDLPFSDFYLDFKPWLLKESTPENFFVSPSAELDNGMVRRFSGFGLNPALCPDAALDLAKNNIEQYFSVVGLVERYPETLELISRTFGTSQLAEERVNMAPPTAMTQPLSDELLKKIQEMNRLDIALYEWVVNRFDWQLKNPSLIKVGSGKRNDIDGIPLWRSVGRSDIREETMLHGAAPQSKQSDINSIFFEEILDVRNHSGMILADVAAFSLKPYQSPESMGPTRLILSPETAKAIIEALEKVLDVN